MNAIELVEKSQVTTRPDMKSGDTIRVHVKVREGERVFTSGYSLFPPGILVGNVLQTGLSDGDSFLNIQVKFSTQFHNLRQVYVVVDLRANEKRGLESQNERDG